MTNETNKKLPLNSLLKRGYTTISEKVSNSQLSKSEFATLLNNLSYYGYTLNQNIANFILNEADRDDVISWFSNLEESLKEITKEDQNISEHIVYKNFPQEVIDMSEEEYWINQIFIYLDLFNYEDFEKQDRKELEENILSLKVLSRAPENIETIISKDLVNFKSLWSFEQKEEAEILKLQENFKLTDFGFKENGIFLYAKDFLEGDLKNIVIEDASDVLKLVYKVTELKDSEKEFCNFSRPERRFLLNILENSKHLEEDIALNKKSWKKLLTLLHPHEYNYNRVSKAFFKLCKNKIKGFNSLFNKLIEDKNEEIFDLLKTRAGVFSNSLYQLYTVFGNEAFFEFENVIHNVDTKKLLKIKSYFLNFNNKNKGVIFSGKNNNLVFCDYQFLKNNTSLEKNKETSKSDILFSELKSKKSVNLADFKDNSDFELNPYKEYSPKNIFNKEHTFKHLKINKEKVNKEDLIEIINIIDEELQNRALNITNDQFIDLDEKLKNVKFKNNLNENIPFGAGTSFNIPKKANFIRTASFWLITDNDSVWIDNSLNFFDSNFKPLDVCCWNRHKNNYSVFSGDPVVKHDRPAAAQLIDVDIKKAIENNVRYITMSALSFNSLPFTDFKEAFMSVQYCKEPQSGKPYETKRVDYQFDFAKSKNLDKLFVLFDLKERKMTFIDQSLKMSVRSAIYNSDLLSKYLSYELDNIKNSPSLYDLFETIKTKDKKDNNVKFLYSDSNVRLNKNEKHFVFRKQNDKNQVDFYNIDSFI